ncbi:PaaI family thioesterase [Amycolatopsis sp. NBC_01480]|uniref:PaaI family thioesterase n=1 Tax=Amycolatopsis sp. NBC_01480 TaxID=2903562 RepID=UPI002E296901|nr:PaaI family thioesterase [Amycolatopsis sp. NBC_01480]
MDTTTSPRPPAFLPGGPEALFAVDGLAYADGEIRARMLLGPWSDGPGGAGSIGVLADNILGYALISQAPAGRWSVSTEISIDFLRPLPGNGTWLSARGRTVHRGATTGLAEGSVFGEDGQLIARSRQWGKFVGRGAAPDALPGSHPTAGLLTGLRQEIDAAEGHARLHFDVADELVNPHGTLHGGVTLWAAGLVAGAALATRTTTLHPASITVSYLRPFPHRDVAEFQAEVVSLGRSLALTRVTGRNRAGKPCIVAAVHHHSLG